jgi:tetratricopeptide (TPR) repeat protein
MNFSIKQILLLLMLLLAPALSFSQQARFDEANFLLGQNEYRQALDIYKTVADDGFESGALWYNMGTIYTTLDSLGMAKYYFLQAREFDETRNEANEALQYVNERFDRRSAVLPQLPWDRFFNYLTDRLGPDLLFIIAFIFLYGGTTGMITSWFYSVKSVLFRYTGMGLLIFSGLIFGAAFYTDYLENRYLTGVITVDEQTVYQQPDPNSSVISTAYEGYMMRVDASLSSTAEEWSYVRLENGMFGWVRNNAMNVF